MPEQDDLDFGLDSEDEEGADEDGPTPETRLAGVTLQELSTREGPLAEMAKDLLAIREDRERARAAEEALAAAQGALEAGTFDWSDETALEVLRAEVREADRKAAAAGSTLYAEAAKLRGFSDEEAAGQVARFKAEAGAVGTFVEKSDPLLRHPAYIERETRLAALDRESGVLTAMRPFSDLAAEAQADIDRMLAKAREERH